MDFFLHIGAQPDQSDRERRTVLARPRAIGDAPFQPFDHARRAEPAKLRDQDRARITRGEIPGQEPLEPGHGEALA